MRRHHEALWLLVALLLSRSVVATLMLTRWWSEPWVSHLVQDLRTWEPFFRNAQAGYIPYVHYTTEYPALAGVLYWCMSPFVDPGNLRQTVAVHAVFSLIADGVSTVLFYRMARRYSEHRAFGATLILLLNPTALILSPVRFEPHITMLVLGGLAFHASRRYHAATALWALAANMKWYPAFFVAIQEWELPAKRGRLRHWCIAGVIFVGVCVAVNGPFVGALLASGRALDNWLTPYVFHIRRPLYWDTVLGVIQIWAGPLPWERFASWWSLVLMLGAIVCLPRGGVESKGVLICIAALLLNRLYSTQFNLWFYPLVLLGACRDSHARYRLAIALLVAMDLVNIAVYPFTFTAALNEMGGFFPLAARGRAGAGTVLFSVAILLRAAMLVVLALFVTRGMRQEAAQERDMTP